MGYGMESGFSNGNVVQIVTSGNIGFLETMDHAVWATDEEYTVWNGQQLQGRVGVEPGYKKARVTQTGDMMTGRAKETGRMFYKTKLCCMFRVGICPYVTNCNFAHSLEELRKPPPNWQDIVAGHDGDKKAMEPREEFKIPSVVSNDFSGDGSRSSKGRHCKKFCTSEGCSYGDSCTYIYDEPSRARESVAISLNAGSSGGSGGNGTSYVVSVGGLPNIKPANWKTKLCNKWEMTGFCPFGSKCYFAHGAAELNQFGRGSAATEVKGSSAAQGDFSLLKKPGDNFVASTSSRAALLADIYKTGTQSQRAPCAIQGLTQRIHQKWKGPNKISRIYGDWIDNAQ